MKARRNGPGSINFLKTLKQTLKKKLFPPKCLFRGWEEKNLSLKILFQKNKAEV